MGDTVTFKASDLVAMLRLRYQTPEWAVLEELQNSTGGGATRRFDVVAFNCWPSGGFIRLGFEVKVSRGDFTRELDNHEKRTALEKLCHEVYFVVCGGVCQPREVPEPWGLLEVRGDKLHRTRKAMHRKVGPINEPLAICAIRRLTDALACAGKRHYLFSGTEITQDDIDTRVEHEVRSARDAIAREREMLRSSERALQETKDLVVAEAEPWRRVWREVDAAAHGRRFPGRTSCAPPSSEELKMAIERIRFAGQAALAGHLRDLRSRLDNALTAIEVVDASGPLESDG